MIIRISSGVFESLRNEAAAAHPRECCGLMTGKPGLIEAVLPAKNVSPHPETAFEIDPGTLMRIHREVRDIQRHVIGHYHSHPNGSAEPSARDAARATHDGQVWIIIAGDTVTGWQAVNPDEDALHSRFRPVRLLPV